MQEVICKALDEGRLAYKVLEQNFQSCNGGTFDWRGYLPGDTTPGPWLPEIKDCQMCETGYHFTLDPLIWPGCVVFLAEVKESFTKSAKQVFGTGRLLKRLWPGEVINLRIWVRLKYPFLRNADLRNANLRNANLGNADLRNANRLTADPAIPGWKLENGILVKEVTP